jgi:2-oxoisovalerate dehydrogenase E1 component alpha subunit
MLPSRILDEKMMNLLRQGKSLFHISTAGHEPAQVGTALCFKLDYKWCYPYHRDQASILTWGVTCYELLLFFLGCIQDMSAAGRQTLQHYGHAALRMVSQSSSSGTLRFASHSSSDDQRKYRNGCFVERI